MAKSRKVINADLLFWCTFVLLELITICCIVKNALALLFGLVLIEPYIAAFNWPMNIPVKAKNEKEKALAEEAK